MSSGSNTTIASWALAVRETLLSYNVDANRLFREAGIPEETLRDPLSRIPVSAMTKLWNGAVEATGDESFGLQVAGRVTPSTFFALGITTLTSENAFQAAKMAVNSSSLMSTGAFLRVGLVGGMLLLEFGNRPGCPEYAPAAVYAGLASCLHMGRKYIGVEVQPDKVSFRHAAPEKPQVFESWFGCPVEFHAERNALYTSRIQDGFKRFPTANSALLSFNAKIVSDYIAKLRAASIANRVRNELSERLEKGKDVDQKTVSRSLGMSERKLQIGLKGEGTSFQGILDWVRETKAIHLLTIDGEPVSDVALRLGFREISSFTRAFKRWTGKTPRQFIANRF